MKGYGDPTNVFHTKPIIYHCFWPVIIIQREEGAMIKRKYANHLSESTVKDKHGTVTRERGPGVKGQRPHIARGGGCVAQRFTSFQVTVRGCWLVTH